MANTIALRRRIKSVKSTRQITKAMELVSASKMRRAQESALASREFTTSALQVLTKLRQLTDVSKHPLYDVRQVKAKLYIVITSDRGLAGAYDSNVLRAFAAELRHDQAAERRSMAILVGKKAGRFAANLANLDVLGVYDHMPERPSISDIRAILTTAKAHFVGDDASKTPADVDQIVVVCTHYVSSIVQEVRTQNLLPAAFEQVQTNEDIDNSIFEPSPEYVLQTVTERLIEIQLLQTFLESQASEQSARMMAMKTASDNAGEIIDDLTLAANTARQAAITQELAEITGGAEAIK